MHMALRLTLALIAFLAVASVASADCYTCLGGTCQPSWDGKCSATCCNEGAYAPCPSGEPRLWCPTLRGEPSYVVPRVYFATTLPLVMEGSALRLQYTKAQKVRRSCLPLMARRDAA